MPLTRKHYFPKKGTSYITQRKWMCPLALASDCCLGRTRHIMCRKCASNTCQEHLLLTRKQGQVCRNFEQVWPSPLVCLCCERNPNTFKKVLCSNLQFVLFYFHWSIHFKLRHHTRKNASRSPAARHVCCSKISKAGSRKPWRGSAVVQSYSIGQHMVSNVSVKFL